MWLRHSFHECAIELMQCSERFRTAWKYNYRYDIALAAQDPVIQEESIRGIEILKILALSIRPEQDYSLIPKDTTVVGAIKESATNDDVNRIIRSYVPPYTALRDFTTLNIRQALNKIAHADPKRAGLFADAQQHDLILSGDNGRRDKKIWIAVLSLIDLCKVVMALPDHKIPT
jgi:hypothetical protein